MPAELDQHDEQVKVANDHTVEWKVVWDWPDAINMNTAGMTTQLTLKYWYTKPDQPDTEKRFSIMHTRSFNGNMLDRIYGGFWQGIPYLQGQLPPPPGGGWTMNIKYTIVSVLTWYEGLTHQVMTQAWNSGVYLHAM